MTILKEQVASVINRRGEYELAAAYYEGSVGERFTTPKMRSVFAKKGYNSRLNFCRPVVDAVYNRLEISAVLGTSEKANKVIAETWDFNELDLEADEITRKSLYMGDGYLIAWPDEDGNMELAYSSPLTTSIVYDPQSPKTKLYAVKMWEDNGKTRMNVFTKERITKYVTNGTSVTEGAQWTVTDSIENPFNEIPVFHFRTERPFGRPEHKDAYDSQDYINKQFATSMYVTEYQGASQRWALTTAGMGSEQKDFEEGDSARDNMGALKNGPGELWYMDGVDKVGEFKPADPKVFWDPITNTVRSMASLTNTPLHYFEKTGNVPSGEALRVAEAPLVKKVERRQQSFGQTWREIFRFVLRVNGIKSDVQVKWKTIESLDVLEVLDAMLKQRNVGLSIAQVMRENGYDEEVIARVLEEAKAERDADMAGYQRAPETRVQPDNDERNVENG